MIGIEGCSLCFLLFLWLGNQIYTNIIRLIGKTNKGAPRRSPRCFLLPVEGHHLPWESRSGSPAASHSMDIGTALSGIVSKASVNGLPCA
jgi:hypothetical protein